MRLVDRVSAFFLLALGVCLIGYSAGSYAVIRHYLYAEFDGQLSAARNVVVAALEVEPDAVKWQPQDHTLELGDDPGSDDVRWMIVETQQHHVIDQSINLDTDRVAQDQLQEFAFHPPSVPRKRFAPPHDQGHWRVLQQFVAAPGPAKPANERDFDEFDAVSVAVARDIRPLESKLWQLAWLAVLMPLGIWLAAAVAGRAYCRHALHPVGEMAQQAQHMTGTDFKMRLSVPEQEDELSTLANAFNGLLDRLYDSYQQQQRFTGDAAHQLRTPLTILRGEIDVALRRERSSDEYRNILKTLSAQTSELQQIVESLLFLARSEAGSGLPELQSLDLQEWLPEYLSRWQSHHRYHDILFEITGTPRADASRPLLGQALDNLIGNAAKYSPPATPIQVTARNDGTGVTIEVRDEGPGIPVEDQPHVFEPFYRSEVARRSGVIGTGLGLAIVARVAEAHHGRISYESNNSHGSCFRLWLPSQFEAVAPSDATGEISAPLRSSQVIGTH